MGGKIPMSKPRLIEMWQLFERKAAALITKSIFWGFVLSVILNITFYKKKKKEKN